MEKNKTILPINKITVVLISKILKQYFKDIRYFDLKIIEKGYENVSVMISTGKHKYVLRIYNRYQFGLYKRTRQSISWELDLIEFASKKGVPVPKIIYTLDKKKLLEFKIGSHKYFIILTEYIKGQHLKRLTFEKQKEIISYQAIMHEHLQNFKTRHKRSQKDQLDFEKFVLKHQKEKIKKYEKYHDLLTKLSDIVSSFHAEMSTTIKKYKKIPIHNDMHKENLKFFKGRISGIFDFDDSLMGVPHVELGKTLFFICTEFLKPELLDAQIDALLDHYSKTNKLSEKKRRMVKSAFILSWATHKLFFFQGNAKDIKYSGNCLKYHRYLNP
ncbi:MAG: phosphotransferase [Candidatus Pacebacteria bacterium]|nr:phosphotransferase [Candidatus Paceibacterota bacterium]